MRDGFLFVLSIVDPVVRLELHRRLISTRGLFLDDIDPGRRVGFSGNFRKHQAVAYTDQERMAQKKSYPGSPPEIGGVSLSSPITPCILPRSGILSLF